MSEAAMRRRRTAGGSKTMVHQDGGQQLFEQVLDLIEREKERSWTAGANDQEVGMAMMGMLTNLAAALIHHFCEDPMKALITFTKIVSRSLENQPRRPPFDDRRETKH
jgi:hypothetical protein